MWKLGFNNVQISRINIIAIGWHIWERSLVILSKHAIKLVQRKRFYSLTISAANMSLTMFTICEDFSGEVCHGLLCRQVKLTDLYFDSKVRVSHFVETATVVHSCRRCFWYTGEIWRKITAKCTLKYCLRHLQTFQVSVQQPIIGLQKSFKSNTGMEVFLESNCQIIKWFLFNMT